MSLHVQISGRGFSFRVSNAYNLSEQELRERFIDPWDEGRTIVCQGKVFDPADSELKILDGPDVSNPADLTAWLSLLNVSTDVTDRFVVAPPGSRATPKEQNESALADLKRVAVIHGRDTKARRAFRFPQITLTKALGMVRAREGHESGFAQHYRRRPEAV